MTSAVTALILSFVASLVLTPLVRRWALRIGAVDEPGGRRVHLSVTPRMGGIAVMLSFFAPLLAFSIIRTQAMRAFLEEPGLVLGLGLGGAGVVVVGAIDDVRGLGPWPKLLCQTAAASIAYAAGYRIEAINIPLYGDLHIGMFALPVTIFWFLAITNAINLIDGLDGLAAGITFFATITNFALAQVNQSAIAVLLSASLAGALLGFLRYNFNPATIFLGDSGSMFLGFTLAATSLAGGLIKSSTAVALLVPIIALGVPILDTFLAMIRRSLARQPIFSADRGHIHHRMLELGLTHRGVVLVLYCFSILLAVAAVGIAFGRSWNVGVALVVLGVGLFSMVRLGFRIPHSASEPSPGDAVDPWTDDLSAQVDRTAATIRLARDENQLKQALAHFDRAQPSIVRLTLVESELGCPVDLAHVYELEAGARTRFLELRFTRALTDAQQARVLSAIKAVIDASRSLLSELESDVDASRRTPSQVRAAGWGT